MFRPFLPLSCLLACFALIPHVVFSQCMSYPVPFTERIQNASAALLGTVTAQHCYADEKGNIYTLNTVKVDAWIKGTATTEDAYVITVGGVMGDKAQVSYPAVQLNRGERYFFMLEADNFIADDDALRSQQPLTIQAMPYADAQGAWLYQSGSYHDLFTEGALTEIALLAKIRSLTGLEARKPGGGTYTPLAVSAKSGGTNDITSFSPNPTNAGTINPSDYLTISGTGFGATPGTVQFPNADNGGSTMITPPNASDYVTWTDNTIVVKVPTGSSTNAGSGFFTVNGLFSSPSALTIRYSHISINSDFSGFSAPVRQRYYLRNTDGSGGYTFVYHTNFSSNPPAAAALERALKTWTCNTGINWKVNGTTFSGYADDGENVVLFDGSLPSGVLARATSRFQASATSVCNLQNTVWWLDEIDIQARETGVTWQFGPALATGSQFDFETVVLHELGHAHGLGHRIAPGQLMNYAVASATNIRTPAPQEIQGGQDKMAYSTVPTCFNPTNSGTPMIAAACPLPLTLIRFTATLKNPFVELEWATLNEVNTARFEVEKSYSGADFTAIGTVAAMGNTANETTYRFPDYKLQKGTNYYRLKMVDKDGSYRYSAIVTVQVKEDASSLSVYPNPVRNELVISSAVKTTANLFDGNGKLIRQFNIAPGTNHFDAHLLSSCVYYLLDSHSGSGSRILVIH
ncbi:MAG TPA: matrixin family metalloprotease [Chitinophagaceae bacterium]